MRSVWPQVAPRSAGERGVSDILHAMDMHAGLCRSLVQVGGLLPSASGLLGSAWLLHFAAAPRVDGEVSDVGTGDQEIHSKAVK